MAEYSTVSVEVVILVDQFASGDNLRTEDGLAISVSGPDRSILFDSAATGETLLHNASTLGVDLGAVDSAIISHGHADHTGGLSAAVASSAGMNVYVHPAAFYRRWADMPGQSLRDISCPHSIESLCECGAVFHPVKAPQMLEDWLVLSGPVGGPGPGPEVFVVRKEDELVVDRFEDEMFMLLRGTEGWTLLTGCCHRGLKNTLRSAKFLTHGQPVVAIVGGMHLADADEQDIQAAAELLESYGAPHLYPCHCTGTRAIECFDKTFPNKVHVAGAGTCITV